MARKFLLGVLALAALAWPGCVVAQGVKATVLSIGDGDTIRVRQAGKALTVRLACIDAPETAQTPHGHQARSYLHQRLPIGREVVLNACTYDRNERFFRNHPQQHRQSPAARAAANTPYPRL